MTLTVECSPADRVYYGNGSIVANSDVGERSRIPLYEQLYIAAAGCLVGSECNEPAIVEIRLEMLVWSKAE